MEVRFFDREKDYAMVKEWYARWKYLPIPLETMPPHGLIVSNDSHDIGAAWLYITNAKIALIEGAILNPDAPKSARKGSHDFIIHSMEFLAKECGCLDMWVISKDRFITSICKKIGFTDLEKDFRVLIKRL